MAALPLLFPKSEAVPRTCPYPNSCPPPPTIPLSPDDPDLRFSVARLSAPFLLRHFRDSQTSSRLELGIPVSPRFIFPFIRSLHPLTLSLSILLLAYRSFSIFFTTYILACISVQVQGWRTHPFLQCWKNATSRNKNTNFATEVLCTSTLS